MTLPQEIRNCCTNLRPFLNPLLNRLENLFFRLNINNSKLKYLSSITTFSNLKVSMHIFQSSRVLGPTHVMICVFEVRVTIPRVCRMCAGSTAPPKSVRGVRDLCGEASSIPRVCGMRTGKHCYPKSWATRCGDARTKESGKCAGKHQGYKVWGCQASSSLEKCAGKVKVCQAAMSLEKCTGKVCGKSVRGESSSTTTGLTQGRIWRFDMASERFVTNLKAMSPS